MTRDTSSRWRPRQQLPICWVATGALQFGSIGRDNLTVAATTRQMYVAGYDSRHFLTMATSPAVADLLGGDRRASVRLDRPRQPEGRRDHTPDVRGGL